MYCGILPLPRDQGRLIAIGVILILKQILHVLGHHVDPEGDMAFEPADHQNTFSQPIPLISASHSRQPSKRVGARGAHGFLAKPFENVELEH